MDDMEKVQEKDLKQALKNLNNFKEGAYIYFNGVIGGRMTFHRFVARLDNKNSKIIIQDSIKNDTMEIDTTYISNIMRSKDNRKLQLFLENEETILFEI